jgi:hypothetical protein
VARLGGKQRSRIRPTSRQHCGSRSSQKITTTHRLLLF